MGIATGMRFRDTLEDGADFAAQIVTPLAEKVRDTADSLIDRIGSESREIGDRVGDNLAARVGNLSETTLAKLNLVPAGRARMRTWQGLLGGMVIGALFARLFSGEAGARRRQAIRRKLGMVEPEAANYNL